MTRSIIVFSIIGFCVIAFATPLAADPSSVDVAEQAYREGRRFYDLRDWDRAIERFRESYRLRGDRASLFNIAQAYRLKGDCAAALGYYETYRRNYPDATNLDTIDHFVAMLAPCAEQQSSLATTKSTDPHDRATSSVSAEAADAAGADRHRGPAADAGASSRTLARQEVGIGIAGGVALIATGVAFAVQPNRISDAVESGTGTWEPSVQIGGERAARLAKISLGMGGIAVAAGALIYLVGRDDSSAGALIYLVGRDDSSTRSIALVPSSSGGVVTWGSRF